MSANNEDNEAEGDLFRKIFENANDGIIVLDIKGKVLLANKKAISLSPGGVIQKGIRLTKQNIFNENTQENLVAFFKRTLENGSEEEDINASFTSGESRWFNLSSSVIRENGTGPTRIAIIISDISKQKKYADMLRENQARYKTVVENLHEGLGIIDVNEKITFANRSFCKMLGLTNKKILNMDISDVIQSKEFKLVSQKGEGSNSGIYEKFESWITTSKGTRKRIMLSTAPWFNEEGEYRGSVCLLLDLTDRMITERSIKENEEKYRATVEQSAENIYIYDVESGKVVESNKALQDLLGYNAREMEGMKASNFVAHSKRNIGGKINEVLEKGHAIVGERKYLKKNGESVDVEVSASRIIQGEKSMLCVVSRDITERKQYQAQLIDEKNTAEFYLDLLAHDMGNLLHGLSNGLEAFDIVRGDDQREDGVLNMIRSLTERSIKLANDVITFSHTRDSEVHPKNIDLRQMITSAIEKAKNSFPEATVSLSLDLENAHTVFADELLEKVFFNLFHNSIKAQQKDEVIIGLKSSSSEENTIIEVWDHGGGISEEMKSRLFDRLENVDLRRHTGMGMTIISIAISRYNGKIEVEDLVADGKVIGTIFRITLPSGQ